ncbi:MAG: GGDEF domain-containing protein [Terracidiphilus sp.]|jgi:diguanylate cyclase (GGDEF)-like protein
MAAAVFVCCIFAAISEENTTTAAAIGYLSLVLAFFACSAAIWTKMRSAKGELRIRWALVAGAAFVNAVAYIPSFAEFMFKTPSERVFQTTCFNATEALVLLAAMLFFAGVSRWVVIVDTLQFWLFFLLRFILVYSPLTRDHFTSNHLLITQLVALFLFLVPVVALLGAASRAEVSFLRTLSWLLGLRLIGYFLSDQVSYIWLGYLNCSLWDVPGSGLIVGFAVYLLYSTRSADSATANKQHIAPSLIVRSLMPSFLAMVNLMLGLFVLQISVNLAAIAISITLVCYVVRTGLLQAQVMNDKALLQSRNEQLEGLAVRDHLTGIGNRRSLAQAYGNLSARAGAEKLSLLLTDIDCFKQANDFHGHLYGDKVLIALAEELETIAASVPNSHCARLGGDEFALLLPDATPQSASDLADELHSLFSSHRFQTDDAGTTLSIGIASLQAARDLPLETLVCRADEALYRAKNLGRNRTEVQPLWEPGAASAAPKKHLELQRNVS